MKRIVIAALSSGALLLCSSCASVFCGSRARVTFDTNVPVREATLVIDGEKHNVNSFPYSTKVKRGFNDTPVRASAEGYEDVRFTIYKTFNPVSVINLTNIIGWGIDAATGAMMKPDQNYYEINFTEPSEE